MSSPTRRYRRLSAWVGPNQRWGRLKKAAEDMDILIYFLGPVFRVRTKSKKQASHSNCDSQVKVYQEHGDFWQGTFCAPQNASVKPPGSNGNPEAPWQIFGRH
eukprot:s184_g14.t1